MSNDDLVDLLTNALGNPNFDPDTVIKALAEKANEMQQRGEHPGSLYAIANLLPEITHEAKRRY
jgi:hypothetical protein